MDQLKSAISDKILELSTSDSSEIKVKLDKINRFRDFIDACQSLINKYPTIKSELLNMIANNDFDARIAASRVDSIIRLSESTNHATTEKNTQEDITELKEITEHLPSYKESADDVNKSSKVANEEAKQLSDIEMQELKGLPIEEVDYEKEEQYVDFEEIKETSKTNEPLSKNTIETEPNFKENDSAQKATIKKAIQVCGIIAVIVALIFIIKFVINNWQIILYILGGCIVAALLIWYLLKKKNN